MLFGVLQIYFVIFQLLMLFKIGAFEREVFQPSNFGEYNIEWKYIGPCENGKGTNEIQLNIKLTKKNKRAQMFGNNTFLIPWDENVNMHMYYMKLGFNSNSAWTSKVQLWTLLGCTQYRILFAGTRFLNHMRLPNRCPIAKGIYVMEEYDAGNILEDAGPLIPKKFFYGNYKIFCELKKFDTIVGCATIAIDVIPKWQRRNKTRYE